MTPALLPTPAHARLTLFGQTGNGGLALDFFDLCQSNDPRAWEMAAAKGLEMLHAVRQVLIGMEQDAQQPVCPVLQPRIMGRVSGHEVNEALGRASA